MRKKGKELDHNDFYQKEYGQAGLFPRNLRKDAVLLSSGTRLEVGEKQRFLLPKGMTIVEETQENEEKVAKVVKSRSRLPHLFEVTSLAKTVGINIQEVNDTGKTTSSKIIHIAPGTKIQILGDMLQST